MNPAVLAWALDEDGRTLDELAERLPGIDPDDLRAWRQGGRLPTTGELSQLAEQLKRPRAMFFLPEPPVAAGLPSAFRYAAGGKHDQVSYGARRYIRRARRAQRVASWLRREAGEEPVDLSHAYVARRPEKVAGEIRAWLDITSEAQEAWPDEYAALHGWRGSVEAAGIFVFQFRNRPR